MCEPPAQLSRRAQNHRPETTGETFMNRGMLYTVVLVLVGIAAVIFIARAI
jgi:hypothetical protein